MKPALLALCLWASCAFANQDQDAYCNYVTEQAAAESARLRSPNVVAGFTQPSSDLPMQAEWGISSSVANHRKAVLTRRVARENCQLYKAFVEAQIHVQFALPAIEADVLRHRLELIEQAAVQLDSRIAANTKLVEAKNATLPALYPLQAARINLNSSRVSTTVAITSTYVPPLSPTPLRELIASKLDHDRQSQKAIARLERQNDWDVALSVGIHHQIHPWSPENVGAYGEVTLSYNLADRAIHRHLNAAVAAYGRWKEEQQGDVARQAEILHQQIAETIEIQEGQLAVLQDEDTRMDQELARIAGNDSNAAVAFRNQLIADQLVLRVDLGDILYRLEKLRAFLRDNF